MSKAGKKSGGKKPMPKTKDLKAKKNPKGGGLVKAGPGTLILPN